MARLRITIEGEMSPEEVKRYIVAAWAGLPHEMAVSEVDLREESSAPPIITYTPEPTPEPAMTEAAPAEAPLVERLTQQKKLSGVLSEIMASGLAVTLPEIVALCRELQEQVPMLQRLGAALEDRITRTWEGMK